MVSLYGACNSIVVSRKIGQLPRLDNCGGRRHICLGRRGQGDTRKAAVSLQQGFDSHGRSQTASSLRTRVLAAPFKCWERASSEAGLPGRTRAPCAYISPLGLRLSDTRVKTARIVITKMET